MKKLTNLLGRFSKVKLTQAEKEDFKKLDLYVEGFFPRTVAILTRLENLGNTNMENLINIRLKKDDGFNIFNMFFRSQDDAWMAEYFKNYYENNQCFADGKFKMIEGEKTKNIPLEVVKKYVKYAPKYKAKRDFFEKDVVRCYISNWVTRIRDDDFFCKGQYKKELLQSPNFDWMFRFNVVSAMQFMNIPNENIEAALEYYAHYWRDTAMKLSFKNHYQKTFGKEYDFENQDSDLKNYEHKWMMIRYNEYFNQHKDSVKKYGKMNLAMKMPKAEIDKTRREVMDFEQVMNDCEKNLI